MSRARAVLVMVWIGFAFAASKAIADDKIPYKRVVDLDAKSGEVVIRHHHDWSVVPAKSLSHTMSAPFGVGNTYSYLAAYAPDGKQLWQVPSPPLTWMGVTGDGQYIIGLSMIKYLNPTQVVIYGVNGRMLARRMISAQCFTGEKRQAEIEKQPENLRRVYAEFRIPECLERFEVIGETALNYVDWYQQWDPGARLVQGDGHILGVDLKDPKGRNFRVPLDEWRADGG
jgi:hypothetical protein